MSRRSDRRPAPAAAIRKMLAARDRVNPRAKPVRDNVPSFRSQQRPELREIVPPADTTRTFHANASRLQSNNYHVRTYMYGECSVIVTKQYELIHMSISHPSRYPTWDEIAAVRYQLIPAASDAVMVLPPEREYINIHNFCFQVHECKPGGLDFALNLPTGDSPDDVKPESPSK
jgi:hypothetical protein